MLALGIPLTGSFKVEGYYVPFLMSEPSMLFKFDSGSEVSANVIFEVLKKYLGVCDFDSIEVKFYKNQKIKSNEFEWNLG